MLKFKMTSVEVHSTVTRIRIAFVDKLNSDTKVKKNKSNSRKLYIYKHQEGANCSSTCSRTIDE
jgi:hypothetical protein